MQATLPVGERDSAAGTSTVVSCRLAGFAAVSAGAEQLAVLRKKPELPPNTTLPPGFLKHSDDQTVLSLVAVSRAMIALGHPTASYGAWGVVAAPNLFGRAGMFQAYLSFRQEGAWGISPHMIPHQSLHAVSGTLSQVLQIRGPNFGISGGPKAAGEAFLVAATMISENNLPGLWVVLSGHDAECLPRPDGKGSQTPAVCQAAALALKPQTESRAGSTLLVSGADAAPAGWPEFALSDFIARLETTPPTGQWTLPGCGWVRLTD